MRTAQHNPVVSDAVTRQDRTPHPIPLPQLSATPLISVIMANYNYGRFLKGAVESVLAQSYQGFELIICEDGSTDDSARILRQLESRDSRIIAINQANAGQAAALNAAYDRARGNPGLRQEGNHRTGNLAQEKRLATSLPHATVPGPAHDP